MQRVLILLWICTTVAPEHVPITGLSDVAHNASYTLRELGIETKVVVEVDASAAEVGAR